MARTTWGPLSTDEQNAIEFAPVGEPGVLAPGTTGGLLKRNADGTIGNSILSESGSVLTAAGRLVIGGGTVTASTPVLDLSQTWNNAAVSFVGANINVVNTASAITSYPFRIQVGGSDIMYVRRDGYLRLIGSSGIESTGNVIVGASLYLGNTADTILLRDGAANTIALRNAANAQTWNVYGTTDAGLLNYRRIRTTMTTGGAATIAAEGLGAGVSGNTLALSANGTALVTLSTGITLSGTVFLSEGFVVHFGTTSGNRLGNTTSQKIGFWGSTPVVQPSSTGETVGFTAGAGTPVTDASTFTGNVGATAYRISDIVKNLKNAGLLAQ